MSTNETHHHAHHKSSKPLWMKIVMVIVVVYVLGGIGFGIATYMKCPVEMDKKCARENKAVVFAAKIYPLPASWVNSDPVWVGSFNKQLDYIKHFSEKSQQQLPDRKTLTDQILNQMMDTIILKKEAAKNKITVSSKDVNDAYQKVVDQNGGKDEVKKVLSDLYGMNESDFKALIKDQLYKEKIQKDMFMQVHAKHILIKDEGQANNVLGKLKNNEKSFEDLAKEFSEDTGSKDNGGDLGWFGRGSMVKEFEDAAFNLQQGQTTQELVKSQFGFHIIKVEEKKGSVDQSFAEWFDGVKKNYKEKIWLGFK